MYYGLMDIVFDPVKNIRNELKHGVSLAAADDLEWETALVAEDKRSGYGENRMIAIGYLGNRLHVVVFVDRDNVRRIICLRKANIREVARYAKT